MKIWVAPINDAPTFTPGAATVTVGEDSGSYSAQWATNVSPGPVSESWQIVPFFMIVDELSASANAAIIQFEPCWIDRGRAKRIASQFAQNAGQLTRGLRESVMPDLTCSRIGRIFGFAFLLTFNSAACLVCQCSGSGVGALPGAFDLVGTSETRHSCSPCHGLIGTSAAANGNPVLTQDDISQSSLRILLRKANDLLLLWSQERKNVAATMTGK
jgi:hypothetical protein